MSDIYTRQIELVEAVNNARSTLDRYEAIAALRGFREGVAIARGWDDAQRGRFLMEADHHYIALNVDRPMCGGVFADWEPEKAR